MPRPISYPNIFGTLSGTVSASLLDQNWQVDQSIFNDAAAGWVNAAVDTGSANAYVITLNPAPSGYLNGFFLSFIALNSNTGSSSINVNGLGNIPIVTSDGSSVSTQMIQAGCLYTMVCLNGAFRIVSPNLMNVNIGEIQMNASPTYPNGWLVCNGEAVPIATFPALYNAIGFTYGNPGGGNFNVPNMVGRIPMYGNPVGTIGGAGAVTLGVINLPSHNHGINDPGHNHGVNDSGHAHTYISPVTTTAGPGTSVFAAAPAQNLAATGNSQTGISIQAAGTSISTQNTGSGAAFSVQNPYMYVNFIIRAYYTF